MHTPLRIVSVAAIIGTAALVAGCSAASEQPSETAVMVGDYPAYESVEALQSGANLVVEAELGEGRNDVLLPDYSSDDPNLNPYAGTGVTPGPDEGAIPITVYPATITAVHEGQAEVGDVIEVQQMGGMLDGISYKEHGVSSLPEDASVLLFLETSPSDPASVLGGDVGAFELEGDVYTSLGDETITVPVDEVETLG